MGPAARRLRLALPRPPPRMWMQGSVQVMVAPSLANVTLLPPVWLPLTLLPVNVALQQLLPVNSNCAHRAGQGTAR
jgi:hypothetical protein